MTTSHTTASREQWLAARIELLEAEKELTRSSDAVARRRQELPWVRLEKEYPFETEAGKATLPDLFGGRSQLLVYHFMFGPTTPVAVRRARPSPMASTASLFTWRITMSRSARCRRAPLALLQTYKQRMGWTFPWASSQDSDFNFEFSSSFTEEQQRSGTIDYNYQAKDTTWIQGGVVLKQAEMCGTDTATYVREQPGMSAFILEDGVVYHTYSTYARGLDGLWGMYQWLDRAPKGRNESGLGSTGTTSTNWCRETVRRRDRRPAARRLIRGSAATRGGHRKRVGERSIVCPPLPAQASEGR